MSRQVFVSLLATLALPGPPAIAEAESRFDPSVLDVPFVAQGRLLCGGASLAMVLRYWGAEDVYAEDFRYLVDDERGGIATVDLEAAARERGFVAFAFRGLSESVRAHLARGRPLVALFRTSGDSFHYVVLIGWMQGRIVYHDPAVGPLRIRSFDEIRESWEAADFWTLLVLPPPDDDAAPVEASGAETGSRDPEGFLELASLHFREKNWREASRWAERALEIDATDGLGWSLLGASRYLEGDRSGALEAWNRRGEPRLDLVEVKGLSRTRQEVVYRHLSLTPRELLTPDSLLEARRRLAELPTVERSRVSFAPVPGGRARLEAFVTERDLFEPWLSAIVRGSIDAATRREIRAVLSSPTGGGERLEAGFRFWEERPAFRVALSAPGALRLPGVVTIEGFVEEETYRLAATAPVVSERRRGIRLLVSDWLSSTTNLGLRAGIDAIPSRVEWAFVGAAVDHRLYGDHISARATLSHWFSAGAAPSFSEAGASLRARSSTRAQPWLVQARAGVHAVSAESPLAFWPGAGAEEARPFLLRGHSLLRNGVLAGDAFGPRILHGSIEAERTVWEPPLLAIGVAAFLDGAWVSGRGHSSIGFGVRFHVLGRAVRVDGATDVTSSGFVWSAGWVESW